MIWTVPACPAGSDLLYGLAPTQITITSNTRYMLKERSGLNISSNRDVINSTHVTILTHKN
jgi:hypothetical protein